MVYRDDFRLAADAASTRAGGGFAAAEGRCGRCGESWRGLNGIYCGRLRRYVEGGCGKPAAEDGMPDDLRLRLG